MSTIKFRRITEYGSLSASGKNPQFNLVDWNGYEKYDIRRWDDTNTQPYKGITFDEEELEELLQALKIAVDAKKSTTPTKVVPCGSATAKIMDIFGFLPQYSDWAKLVTYTDWGYGAKYDLRSWAPDYSKCGKGITLGESECRRAELIHISKEDGDCTLLFRLILDGQLAELRVCKAQLIY